MATQQEVQNAVLLNAIRNAREYGYDSSVALKRDNATWESLGGQAELDRLMQDTAIYDYLAKGSGSGLLTSLATFASEAGVKEGLMLAGLATGANSLGMFGAPASAAPSVAPGLVSAYDPIAAMTGVGTGVSDLSVLNSAMSAPGAAVSGSLGNAATSLGYDALGTAATGAGTTVLPTALDTALTQGYNTLGTPVDALPSAPPPATGYDPIQAMSGTPAPAGVPSTSSPTLPNTAVQTATGGVPQLTAEQIASLQGNPEALAAYQAAGMLPTSTASWLDYISTGLGVVNGVSNILGGNSLDASQIQNMVDDQVV